MKSVQLDSIHLAKVKLDSVLRLELLGNRARSNATPSLRVNGCLILENGFHFLLENGKHLCMEKRGAVEYPSSPKPKNAAFRLENGHYLLLENGHKLTLETKQ